MYTQFPKRYMLDARRTTKGVQSLMGIVSGLVYDGQLDLDTNASGVVRLLNKLRF
jgi:hypothetical protein